MTPGWSHPRISIDLAVGMANGGPHLLPAVFEYEHRPRPGLLFQIMDTGRPDFPDQAGAGQRQIGQVVIVTGRTHHYFRIAGMPESGKLIFEHRHIKRQFTDF